MLSQRAASSLLASSSSSRGAVHPRIVGGRHLALPGSQQRHSVAPAQRASHTCRAFNLNKGPDVPERILASVSGRKGRASGVAGPLAARRACGARRLLGRTERRWRDTSVLPLGSVRSAVCAPVWDSPSQLVPWRLQACSLGLARVKVRIGDPPSDYASSPLAPAQTPLPPPPRRSPLQLPYLLPLLDTLPYGRFLFLQFPFIARALAPLGPVNALYHIFPFAPFIIFLGVYSGVVNNQSLSRYIRYNAMQAVLLDILLM
jgi:hypothetical protein